MNQNLTNVLLCDFGCSISTMDAQSGNEYLSLTKVIDPHFDLKQLHLNCISKPHQLFNIYTMIYENIAKEISWIIRRHSILSKQPIAYDDWIEMWDTYDYRKVISMVRKYLPNEGRWYDYCCHVSLNYDFYYVL